MDVYADKWNIPIYQPISQLIFNLFSNIKAARCDRNH